MMPTRRLALVLLPLLLLVAFARPAFAPVEFTSYGYTWIPTVRDVSGGTDGTYLPIPANAAIIFFSDTPALAPPRPAGATLFQLVLPTWLPRKVFFSRFTIVYGATRAYAAGERTGMYVWVDPKGIAYNSTNPPGQELGSDFTRLKQTVISSGNTAVDFAEDKSMPYPVLLDRDAGDKLVVEVASSVPLSNIGVVFDFLVPATSQPTPLLSGF